MKNTYKTPSAVSIKILWFKAFYELDYEGKGHVTLEDILKTKLVQNLNISKDVSHITSNPGQTLRELFIKEKIFKTGKEKINFELFRKTLFPTQLLEGDKFNDEDFHNHMVRVGAN